MSKRSAASGEKLIFFTVLITLIASTVWVIVSMILAPTETSEPHVRVKSDYVLMLLQCLLGVVAIWLPSWLERRFRILIPSKMVVLYVLFLYGAIYLGEVRNFYYLIPHWDTILHTFSGVMLGALGFSVVNLLNKTDRVPLSLSPAFVALFALCFAMSVGVLWEVYEFCADGLLGTNMQKFGPQDGAAFLGREALRDTMLDLIVDTVGASVVSLVGYLSLKLKNGWLESLLLKNQKATDNLS